MTVGEPAGPVVRGAEEVRRYLAGVAPEAVNLVDVRQDWEYREFHLPGARLIPLGELPDRLGELDRNKPTVTYCRSGRRSAAAAAILAGAGFSPLVDMAGGIMAWNGTGAVGPAHQGLSLLAADADPATVFRVAYGMEVRLGAFYLALAEKADSPEVAAVFGRLAGFEQAHTAMVLALWRRSGAAVPADPETLAREASRDPDAPLEGGLSGEDYLSGRGAPDDPRETLELAMAVEAQAYDLYVRAARLDVSDETRQALTRLAREEKGHVSALSTLLDRLSTTTAS